jgi:hypothetical protein
MGNEIGNMFRGNLKIPSTPPPKKKEKEEKAKQLKRGGRKTDISDNLRNSDTTTRLKELQSCAMNIGSVQWTEMLESSSIQQIQSTVNKIKAKH